MSATTVARGGSAHGMWVEGFAQSALAKGPVMMRIAQQRLQASRRSRALGTLLLVLGWLGFVAAVGMTVWALHDLSGGSFADGTASTVSKIDIVAVAGVTPGLISLLVVAAGAYLRVRSLDAVGHHDDDEAEAHGSALPSA